MRKAQLKFGNNLGLHLPRKRGINWKKTNEGKLKELEESVFRRWENFGDISLKQEQERKG